MLILNERFQLIIDVVLCTFEMRYSEVGPSGCPVEYLYVFRSAICVYMPYYPQNLDWVMCCPVRSERRQSGQLPQ